MKPHLKRKLVLEQSEKLPDGAGGYVESWVPLGALWADIRTTSSRRSLQAGIARVHADHKITIRAAPIGSDQRPNTSQRFRDGLRIYRIQSVIEGDPAQRYLTCFAIEERAI